MTDLSEFGEAYETVAEQLRSEKAAGVRNFDLLLELGVDPVDFIRVAKGLADWHAETRPDDDPYKRVATMLHIGIAVGQRMATHRLADLLASRP